MALIYLFTYFSLLFFSFLWLVKLMIRIHVLQILPRDLQENLRNEPRKDQLLEVTAITYSNIFEFVIIKHGNE